MSDVKTDLESANIDGFLGGDCGMPRCGECGAKRAIRARLSRIDELESALASEREKLRETEQHRIELIQRLASEQQEVRELETQFDETTEALEQKLKALAPHGSCACSYDKPGDVCAHHSPQLQQEQQKVKAAYQEINRLNGEDRPAVTDLVEEIVQLQDERDELANDIRLFIPGQWYCPKCNFSLSRSTISLVSGEIGVSRKDIEEPENCPNDGTAMLRETWQQRAEFLMSADHVKMTWLSEDHERLERKVKELGEQLATLNEFHDIPRIEDSKQIADLEAELKSEQQRRAQAEEELQTVTDYWQRAKDQHERVSISHAHYVEQNKKLEAERDTLKEQLKIAESCINGFSNNARYQQEIARLNSRTA